jgi:hypothetical protein
MSKRRKILTALTEKLKAMDGVAYPSNINSNAFPKLEFWNDVNNFPSIYSSPGSEQREYLPSDFTWGYLGISLKLYCKGTNSQDELEQLLEDTEKVVDANRVLVYDAVNNLETTEILVVSITTDEGLLAPYAVGEINLQVRYQIP